MPNIQVWDRLRAFFRKANIYRTDNIFQDQHALDRVISGGNFIDFSKQSAILEQTNLQINRLERYKDFDMMDEVGEISLALDTYGDEACLMGDARIPLLDGTCPTIKELAEKGLKNRFWVYSYDVSLGKLVPALAHGARISGRNVDIIKINLDDGMFIRCTGDHLFMLRSGEYCKAEDLKPGDSLMPLHKSYRYRPKRGSYMEEKPYPTASCYEFLVIDNMPIATHKWVYESLNLGDYQIIHHKDFNSKNNDPSNLAGLIIEEHRSIHQKYGEKNPSFNPITLSEIKSTLSGWKGPLTRDDVFSLCNIGARVLQRVLEENNITWSEFRALYNRCKKCNTSIKFRSVCNDCNIRYKADYHQKMKQESSYRLRRLMTQRENYKGVLNKVCKHCSVMRDISEYKRNGCTYSPYCNHCREQVVQKRYLEKSFNHKVISVEKDGVAKEVYDIEVPQYHNFAAGNKESQVIVHNSLIDAEVKHAVIVKSKSSQIKKIIEDFLYDTLLIDREIRPMIRYLCKFGDFAAEIVPTKNRDGVSSFRFINVYNFTRVQTKFGDLIGFFFQDPASAGPQFLHPWQVMHLRLLTYDSVYFPYGRCAVQGTKVLTPNGEVEIESIKPGQEVFGFNGYQKIKTNVIDLVDNGMKMTYSLHTRNRRLDLTGDHPIMTLDRNELSYKTVKELNYGDNIIVPEGNEVAVEGISRIEKRDKKQVFDIGVTSRDHNFVANGAVVHNSILDGSRKDFKRLRLMEDAAIIYRICVRGDTRVSTPDGYKYIRDIEVGDTAFCLGRDIQQKPTKIVNKVCNGKDKIFRVFSRHREIYANATHPILVMSPYKKKGKLYHDKLEYIDVKDLKTLGNTCAKYYCHRFLLPRIENDELIRLNRPDVPQYMRITEEIPLTIGPTYLGKKVGLKKSSVTGFLSGSHHLPMKCATKVLAEVKEEVNTLESNKRVDIYECWSYFTQTGVGVEYNIPEYADEDFAQWFGFMIGDGYVSIEQNENNYRRVVGFALGDKKHVNEKYKKLFEKIVGEVSFGQDQDYRLGSYYVYSKHLVKFMKLNGFISGAHNKRIPAWVYKSPLKIQKAFIQGYLDADGSSRYFKGGVTEGHTIECCNKQLVEDFKELIDRMGWAAGFISYREREPHIINKHTGRVVRGTEAWVLYFTKEDLPDHERILGVEEVGEDLVYDVTVENDVHNVIYNGIYTHQTRSPEKRIFSIPVGNIPPKEVPQYIELIARQFKKHKFVDPATGQWNERYSPQIQEDDFFLPKRSDGSGPTIDTLPGAENLDAIADIEYFKKKMVAGLKIPFSRLGIGDQQEPNGKSLAQVSPEFAKSVQWIQNEVVVGLKKMVIIHLALRGHTIDDIKNFDLSMTSASAIDELYRIEAWNTRADIMGNLKDIGWFPPEWIIGRFTDMSPDEIKEIGKIKEKSELSELLKKEDISPDDKKLLMEYHGFLDRSISLNGHKNDHTDGNSGLIGLINSNELDHLPAPNIILDGPLCDDECSADDFLIQSDVDLNVAKDAKKDIEVILNASDGEVSLNQI